MYSTTFLVALAFASVTAFDVELIPMGKHGKTYPSRTFFDKDGQYARLIGPLYGKLKVTGVKLPVMEWKPVNVSGSVTPTIDIRSLFISGEVKFQGLTLYKLDGNVDLCNTNGLDCPYLAGVPIHKALRASLGDLGLFPGWYEGAFDGFTTDKYHKKFKIGRGEFKVKVLAG